MWRYAAQTQQQWLMTVTDWWKLFRQLCTCCPRSFFIASLSSAVLIWPSPLVSNCGVERRGERHPNRNNLYRTFTWFFFYYYCGHWGLEWSARTRLNVTTYQSIFPVRKSFKVMKVIYCFLVNPKNYNLLLPKSHQKKIACSLLLPR